MGYSPQGRKEWDTTEQLHSYSLALQDDLGSSIVFPASAPESVISLGSSGSYY